MKISCLPCSLFTEVEENRMSISDWANAAQEIGYNGFDISMVFLKNHTPRYLSQIKAMLEKVRISLVMATTYPDFTHPLEEQRKREMAYFQRDIALCSELGIPYLRVVAGQAHPQTQRAEGIRNAVENLRRADEYARSVNVMLLYENHAKPSAWHYVDFSYPLDIFYEILEKVSDTGIRLNFDIGNVVSLGEDPLDMLDRVFDRIETIHISDMKQRNMFSPVMIGTGVAPIREVLDRAKRRGFEGWYCIEECSGNGLEGIRAAHQYVRGILEQ